MTVITGTNTWPTGFVAPDDGDKRDAADVTVGLSALANRTKYLYERVINGDGGVDLGVVTAQFVTVTGGSVGSVIPGLIVNELATVGGLRSLGAVTAVSFLFPTPATIVRTMTIGSAFHGSGWSKIQSPVSGWQNDTLGQVIDIELDLPHGATLTRIDAVYTGVVPHANLPGTRPTIRLYSADLFEAELAESPAQSDPAGNVATYHIHHSITLSGLSITINRAIKRYVLRVTPEAGSDSIPGARITGIEATYTLPGPTNP